MTVELVTDHDEQGLALLISQFRDQKFIEILIRAHMAQVQELEVALLDLLLKRTVDTAVGAQLVVIGKLVGQEKGTFDDDTFRSFIRARVLVNRSSGTVDQMVELVNALLPSGISLALREYYPASFEIQLIGSVPDWFGNALAAIIFEAKAVAVGPHVRWVNGTEALRFAAVAGIPDLLSPNGFGNGAFAAGSTGVGDVAAVPSLDFSPSDGKNTQYIGAV